MAEANDSIEVTPGAGALIATQLINGKEYQAIIMANPKGQVIGDIPTYSAWSGTVTASANAVYMHVFNGVGSGRTVTIRKVFIQPSQVATTITTAQVWRVAKTSSVGTTSAVTITPRAHDSTNPAIPSQVVFQRGYSAGGTQAWTWFDLPVDVEETRAGIGMLSYFNILPVDGERTSDFALSEGEGLVVQNLTGSSYSWSVLCVFSVE